MSNQPVEVEESLNSRCFELGLRGRSIEEDFWVLILTEHQIILKHTTGQIYKETQRHSTAVTPDASKEVGKGEISLGVSLL